MTAHKEKSISDVWIGRSPNGHIWALRGRFQYVRIGTRMQFCIKRRNSRYYEGIRFGIGPR